MSTTITTDQIQSWKKQYGDIYKIEVDGKVAYCKTPNRQTLSLFFSLHQNPLKALEVLLDNCWLGGDEEIKTDDALFLGATTQLQQLVQIKEASLKKC